MSNPSGNRSESSLIAKGTTIRGKVTSTEDMRVDGQVDGTLETSGRLIIGTAGDIKGELKTRETVVAGKLDIDKLETQTVNFRSTARFDGEVTYEKISIEEGAIIVGQLKAKINSGKKK